MSEKNNCRYIEVAEELRKQIFGGALKPLEKIPTERELCTQFSVSRITVRRALRILSDERLIQRKQGSGTYVSPKREPRIPLMIDYTYSMKEHAPQLTRSVILWKRDEASESVSEELDLGPDESIIYAERVDDLKGEPIAFDRAHIPVQFARGFNEDILSRVDFVEEWMEKVGFTMESCSQTIEAVKPDPETVKHLRLKRGQWVIKSSEVYFAEGSVPAGLFISFYNPKYIFIRSRFQWAKE